MKITILLRATAVMLITTILSCNTGNSNSRIDLNKKFSYETEKEDINKIEEHLGFNSLNFSIFMNNALDLHVDLEKYTFQELIDMANSNDRYLWDKLVYLPDDAAVLDKPYHYETRYDDIDLIQRSVNANTFYSLQSKISDFSSDYKKLEGYTFRQILNGEIKAANNFDFW